MFQIILLPILSGVVAQLIKFFIASNNLKLSLKSMTAYSGMPSGHSAIVISLVTITAFVDGLDSSVFALSVVFAILTIRDALGIRQYLGQHGKVLNILLKDLDDDRVLDNNYPHLLEKIGHTLTQVLAGSLLGFTVSLIGFFILN